MTRKNPRGLVVEMILPARIAGDSPRALRQLVIFDGVLMERATTKAAPTKHWRSSTYGKGNIAALDVMNKDSWLGGWIENHVSEGYEVYGKPFLIEANTAELEEIEKGNMPRALVLRLAKARDEIGLVSDPWKA